MRPMELTISGWGPYKEAQNIDFKAFFGTGLFLITGATGAGKTTIFDAICFALYGAMSGDVREKNSVRSDFCDAGGETFVELTMEHGGNIYRICRNPEYERLKKRKSGGSSYTKERENATLYMPDGSIIAGSQEVNKRIQELLVLNLKQFKQISMIAQGEFSRLLTAPSKEKITIFREIFGTGVCDAFQRVLRERAKVLYVEAEGIRQRLDEAVNLLSPLKDSFSEEAFEQLIDAENRNYEAIREYLKELEKKYGKRRQKAAKEYDKTEQEMGSLVAAISRIEEENLRFDKLQRQRERLAELREQEPQMHQLEKTLNQAKNAGFLEPHRVKLEASFNQLEKKKDQLEKSLREKEELQLEKKELQPRYRMREKIAEGLILMERCEELAKAEKEQKARAEQLELERKKQQDKYLQQEELCKKSQRLYEEADYAYKRAAAGIVAKLLEDGKPCPVCGSTEHPSPAQIGEDVPDEQKLKSLKKTAEKERETLQNLHEILVGKNTQYDTLHAQCEETELQRQLEEEKLEGAIKYLTDFEGIPAKEIQGRMKELVERYQNLEVLLSEKEESCKRMREEIEAETEEAEDLSASFLRMLKDYGFSGKHEYEGSVKSREEQQEMEERLRGYREESRSLQDGICQLEQEQTQVEKADLLSLQERQKELEKERKQLLEEQKSLAVWLSGISHARASMKEKLKELAAVSEEYGYVKDLDNMAGGTNSKKLVFEQYVLASYFEEILGAANVRFLKMTGGRYEMERSETVGDGRSRDNLEIQVRDYYTGKCRSVKTLSGGESFKASLSLALGMSDVIQAFHGGIRVDTLFVDEGFGSLDSESLDQACEALSALVEKDRLVGIISHVPELRERIDHQLVVEKSNTGSNIRGVV